MEQMKMWNFDTPVDNHSVLEAWQGRVEYWLTRRQIAEAMHRAKTPAVNARCEKLVTDGVLLKQFIKLPNGVDMILYAINTENQMVIQHFWPGA